MSRATRFLDACHGRETDRTPVWLMRQAGRYQASYRAIREKTASSTWAGAPRPS